MGGLDLCFGRWDTNSHPIADVHPTDVNKALFPGQDFNNARVYDFADVEHWDQNKLDRTKNSRMGWSDLSLCLRGPVIDDLKAHFVQRWNFIFKEKYSTSDKGYVPLTLDTSIIPGGYYNFDGFNSNPMKEQPKGTDFDDLPSQFQQEAPRHPHLGALREQMRFFQHGDRRQAQDSNGVSVQLVRSCTKWSAGIPLEVSLLFFHTKRHSTDMSSTRSPMPTSVLSRIANILFTSKISSSSPQPAIIKAQLKTKLEQH
jgi:phospholipase D1/2